MGKHYISALWQRSAGQRVPGVAPHNDGMARGEGLEPLEVVGYVPDEVVVLANGVVLGNGHYDGDVG